jgi:dsDNA-specific endonuclease/ATPase MutS2
VSGRAVVFEEGAVTPIDTRKGKPRRVVPAPAPAPQVDEVPPDSRVRRAAGEVDLHGLTVEEALAAAERAVNDALLGDLPQLRLIHGRSGGRIRAALHRRLRAIPTVRAFRLDPRNAGVTIVSF